uniref:BRCA2-interacting transcriptional repressor EMSY n=1 Tax=Pundamilia nyererei TaxID=303518 RepID=A0A3B4G2F5_9CICH
MPVVWPTILDLGRDECKRILRKLLEAYAGVISALRAQGDLTKDKKDLLGELTKILSISTERHRAEVRRAVNDERLTTIAYSMSGPNSSSEWSIEGRRLVPLMPRLVPQTAFTVTANAVASATANQNASLLLPAETGNKEVVCYSYTSTTCTSTSTTAISGPIGATVKSPRPPSPSSNVVVLPSGSTVYVKVSCSDEDEKPRKRRRTNSSSSSPVMLKEVTKVSPPVSKNITVPVSGSPKMSSIMQSIANSLPPHLSPVKITFTKPTIQTTSTTTQKVIIVTTSPSSNFVPNILSKSHAHNNATAMSKLGSTSMLTTPTQKQTVVFPASSSTSTNPNTIAVTTVVSSTPSAVMSTVTPAGVKVSTARLPSPKTLMASPTQILAQFPVKIITQQVQPSKILPKPSAALSSSSSSPIMVVSSNGAIMTTKLVTQPTTQTTYTRPTVSPNIGARISASSGGTTYVKTTSGSIITVVPKSLATLGGKIISSNIVSGTTTKITTIPMTSKPNVIVVQKTTGKGATIQGLPGKNVVTTLLNAGLQGEKGLQAVQGTKPAIITASRPITKMIVTQPKGMSSGSQATATKIIPTKIVYGQQGKTQVLIKPKPVFQTAVVSEQTRQLVTETLQQVTRSAELSQGQTPGQDGATKDDAGSLAEASSLVSEASQAQPVVHVVSSREQDWTEQEVAVESSPTIIYQEVSGGESQSATSTIKALLELQQKEKGESKPRQHTIDLSQMAVPIQLAQEEAGELEGDTLDPQTGLFYRSTQPASEPTKQPAHSASAQPPPLSQAEAEQSRHPSTSTSTQQTPPPPQLQQQPIITQSATVTKITFGSSHHSSPVFSSGEASAKLIPESSSGPSGDKPSVSDILKISMMEAEIDPSTEPMVVDSSSDCGPLGKALEVQAVSGTLDSGQFISSSGAAMHHSHSKPQQFSCLQGLAAQRSKEDLEVIEVIPQYSILPDSSQSNVVVEPSGFLEITNYTSQQLEEDSPMEQEVDSSNDEAAAASPPDQP